MSSSRRRKTKEQDVDFPDDDVIAMERRKAKDIKKYQQDKKKKKKVKSAQSILDADVDDLVEEVITLKEQLAEERAERVNLEGTLQKSRKKLAPFNNK